MSKNNHYLILSLSGIGNYLMHTPLLRAIKKNQPNSSITVWLAPRNTAVLAAANPDIDHIIRAPIKRSLLGHLRQVSKLRRLSADVGIVLFPGQLWKSALYLYLAGLDTRLGHRYPHLGNPDSSLFLTKSLPVAPQLHDVEQNLALLSALNLPQPTSPSLYEINIPDRHQQQSDVILRGLRKTTSQTSCYIGLHPGSAPNFSWKRWPINNYAKVAKQLIKQHQAHILIFGGNQELPLMKSLRRFIGRQHASIITAHLLTVAAIIQHCQLFIANDSGLMHLAAAVSVPTLGLFGPTDEHRTGPRGISSQPLRAPSTTPVYDVNINYDLGTDVHPSLLSLTPDQVLKAANSLLSANPTLSTNHKSFGQACLPDIDRIN